MTGSTNQVQTPLGSGVKSILGNGVNTANGLGLIPANPNVTVTGTSYGALFTVWEASVFNAGGYTPVLAATYNNTASDGVGGTLPTITTLNLGSIQVLINNQLDSHEFNTDIQPL